MPFTIGQEQTTQRRPHARPCTVPRVLLSDKNNTTFYYKQLLRTLNSGCKVENNGCVDVMLEEVRKELLLFQYIKYTIF